MARRLRRIAKKGKKLARRVAKSKVARELARREMEIASEMLANAAKKMREKARKMK